MSTRTSNRAGFSRQHEPTPAGTGLSNLSTPTETGTQTPDEILCEECLGKGVDIGSLYEPEECKICMGSGYLMSPEFVERTAEQHRRRPVQREIHRPGYFEERAWRRGE